MAQDKIVLVVEDERPLLEAISKKLESQGILAVTARSVDQAASYLEDVKGVNLIWLDHYLLGPKDGIDFVNDLKRDAYKKDIPIFVVSNTASPDKRDEYIKLGVDRVYTKADYKLDDIIKEIKLFLEKK
ncbi:MAG TPA: response regulator [Candidatus Paceibacterota bacterium]